MVHDELFRAEHHVGIMGNDSNELIGRRQQGGVLLSVRKNPTKHS